MARERVDGHKFEAEFEKVFGKAYYISRLHTPSSRYAGLTQPADYLLFGFAVHYIELKETSSDSFSLSSIEQLDEIKKFIDKRYMHVGVPLFYFLIVHFIKRKVIKVIEADTVIAYVNSRKQLKYNDPVGFSFNSLKQMKETFIL